MPRGRGIRLAILLCAAAGAASAQETLQPVVAEFPLPAALTGSAEWDAPGFLAGWGSVPVSSAEEHRIYRGRCEIFGHRAQSVTGLFEV